MKNAPASIEDITQKLFFRLPDIRTQTGLVFGAGSLTGLVAAKAASYYQQNKIGTFVTTGGVIVREADYYAEMKPLLALANIPLPEDNETEGDYAARIIIGMGVPANKIAIENSSMNTGENIANAMTLGLSDARSITLFGLAHAQWRNLATLRKHTQAVAAMAPLFPFPNVGPHNWFDHPFANAQVRQEHAKLDDYVAQGFCVDINIAMEQRKTELLRERQSVTFAPAAP
jgi:hypothetical protein